MSHAEAPEDLKKCFMAEQYNGFGFQYEGLTGGELCLAFISKRVPDWADLSFDEQCKISDITHATETEKMRTATGSQTVYFDEWLGNNFIAIHWTEWELIPTVLQYALDDGYQFRVNHKPRACFKPGDTFSLVNMEHQCIKAFNGVFDRFKEEAIKKHQNPYAVAYDLLSCPRPLLCHWNWSTTEGIEFCTMLRGKLRKKPISKIKPRFAWENYEETCKKYNMLHHGVWSRRTPMYVDNMPPADAGVAESTNDKRKRGADNDEVTKDDSADDLCYVCYENPANTLVMPCGHVCVCAECSDKLVDTNDKDICVRCRRNIESVMEDGKERGI